MLVPGACRCICHTAERIYERGEKQDPTRSREFSKDDSASSSGRHLLEERHWSTGKGPGGGCSCSERQMFDSRYASEAFPPGSGLWGPSPVSEKCVSRQDVLQVGELGQSSGQEVDRSHGHVRNEGHHETSCRSEQRGTGSQDGLGSKGGQLYRERRKQDSIGFVDNGYAHEGRSYGECSQEQKGVRLGGKNIYHGGQSQGEEWRRKVGLLSGVDLSEEARDVDAVGRRTTEMTAHIMHLAGMCYVNLDACLCACLLQDITCPSHDIAGGNGHDVSLL